jgi:UDP-glucose 4-epimerase
LLEIKDHHVYIFDNFQAGSPDKYTKGATIIKGDVRDMSDWSEIPPVDYVFHFAAPSSVIAFNKSPQESIKITLKGITNCIEWAIINNAKKIIYPSSGSVYGPIQGKCREEGEVNPLNIYGKTKLECERIAQKYEKNIPLLGLRIFAGYGPQEDQKGELASVVSIFLKKIQQNQTPLLFGDGSQTRDFIYIDDIVSVLLKVLDNTSTGILNVGSGSETSFDEVLSYLNIAMKTNIKAKYAPPPANYLLSTKADITKLKKYLPCPLSLEQGIARMIKC